MQHLSQNWEVFFYENVMNFKSFERNSPANKKLDHTGLCNFSLLLMIFSYVLNCSLGATQLVLYLDHVISQIYAKMIRLLFGQLNIQSTLGLETTLRQRGRGF